ncbi:hypothetical protein THAOC_17986, partial [Thalassiosira oceanica]
STSANALIFAHLAIRNDTSVESDNCKYASVFEKLGVPVFTSNIIQDDSLNQDAEASAITMLQHFEYQQRLLPAIYACVEPETYEHKKLRKKEGRKSKKKKESAKKRKRDYVAFVTALNRDEIQPAVTEEAEARAERAEAELLAKLGLEDVSNDSPNGRKSKKPKKKKGGKKKEK